MKFSYAMLPDYPLEESLRAIRLADELGFYAVLRGRRDLAQGPVAAVRRGRRADERVRMGPSVSGVVLREPTLSRRRPPRSTS